jgi:chromate transporter
MAVKTDLLGQLAVTFGTLSLVAIGGANAVVPELHRQAVTLQGWMSDTTFANLFAIAQAAPGPNVMIASLIGWHLAGPLGLLVATLGMCLPSSLLTFSIARLRQRVVGAPWLKTLQLALTPIPIGLMAASGVIMARAADSNMMAILLTVATAIYVGFTQRNPIWALVIGGLAGVVSQILG